MEPLKRPLFWWPSGRTWRSGLERRSGQSSGCGGARERHAWVQAAVVTSVDCVGPLSMQTNLEDHIAALEARVRRLAGPKAPRPTDRAALERLLTDLSADIVHFEVERLRAAGDGRDADAVALEAAITALMALRRPVRTRLEIETADLYVR